MSNEKETQQQKDLKAWNEKNRRNEMSVDDKRKERYEVLSNLKDKGNFKRFITELDEYQAFEDLILRMSKNPIHEYQVKAFWDSNKSQAHSPDFSKMLDLLRYAKVIIKNPPFMDIEKGFEL